MLDRFLTAESPIARTLRGIAIATPTVILFTLGAILDPSLLAQ